MKIRTSQRVSASLLVLAATMNFANAATYYWDSNGTSTTGAGATPTGTWGADVFWNTSPTGDAGTITALTTALDDVFFSAGTDAVNPYTVTLNGTQNARLVTFEDGTVTLSGGTLNLGAGGGITVTTNTVTGSTISSGLTITGRQTFNVAAGRTLTLDTGTFTRNAGATLDISGTVTSTMTNLSANDATGIIGNWAFFGNSYANFTGSTITALGYTGGADGTSVAASTSVVTGAGGLNYKLTAGIGTLGLNASVNTLQVSAGGTLANNGTFTTNGIYNTSGAGLTFSGPITIGSSNELVVNTNGGGIIFSGAIGGAAGASFTKLGGQNLTFNGANSYTGATNVNVGTLTIGAGGSINAASAINIQSGATLATSINNSFSGSPTGAWTVAGTITGTANAQTIPTSVTLNNGTMSGTLFASFGTFLTQSVGATITANGNSNTISAGNFGLGGTGILTLSTPLATDTLNFSSVIGATSANAGGLSKSGLGALTLSAASTYTGGTTMSAGTININSVGAAGNGPLGNGGTFVINGGAIDNTSGSAKVVVNVNPITLGGNFAFSTSAGTANNNLTLPGAITMAADRTFTLNGAGALTLSGLLTNTADSVRTLTVNNGAGTTAASLLTIGSYNLTGAGSTAARNNIINGTGNVTISGVVGNGISAGSGLTYNGIGVLTLGGANTFTGQLTVATGTLSIASINNVSANGTLGNSDMNLPVILGSSGGNTGTLRYTAASGSSDKAFTLAAGGTGAFDVTTALTLIGLIDGSGNLTKTGAGNLTLGQTFTNTGIGLAPQFTGVTTIINGKIILTQAQTSGSNNALNGSLLGLQKSVYDTTGSSASLDVTTLGAANGVLWLGGLQGSSVNLATAVSGYNRIAYLNLSPQTGTSASYGAVIADGAAGMIVDKLGPGTQTLTGINSYSGATVIYAGTLGLGSATNAGGSLLNSAVTVRGGTLLLDNSFGWTNRIADTLAPSALSLGSLTLKSYNGAGAQTETVGATTFAVGGKVTINNGSTVGDQTTFAMGTVTRSAGAAIDFVGTNGTLGAGANSPNVTTSGTFPGGSNGILPWATVGGTSWAGTASTTNIVAYAGAFVDPTSAASNAADNARLTGSGTMNAVKSFNSLNVISNLAGQSLDLSTAGVLTLTSGAILKSGTNAYTISGSAASAITAGTELIAHVDGGALTISAPLNTAIVNLAKGGTGALVLSGTRAANFTGSVGITGTLEFQGASTTLSGLVTGPGNLTVNLNAGQTLLINNGANTFSGNILVKGGILADGSFDAGLSVAPGVGNTTVGAVGNPNKSAGSMNNIELNGGILAANYAFGRFLGAAPDQFQITGGVSGISTNNGTFTIGGSTNYEAVWGSIYFQPTTLVLNDAVAGASAVLTWGNKLDLNGATRTIATNSAAFGATLSGVIRDTVGGAGLTKIGVGSLTLSGANSFNGGLLIQNGTLSATTSTSALGGTTGAGAVTLGSSTFGNGATLNIDGRNFTNPITLGSGATGTLTLGNSATAAIYSGGVSGSNGFTINNSGGSNTLTFQAGNITSSGLITNLGTSTGATTISSNITSANTAGLIQNSSGSLVLSGTNNYSGPTTITQGTLQFTKLASLYNNTAASWIPTNLNVVLGATLALNVGGSGEFATTDLVTFLDGSHMGLSTPTTGFKSGSALGLDTTNAGGTFTPTAFIGNPGTSTLLGLTKLGTGTLILNLANTYTGATTISNGGTLQIGSGSAAGSIANTSGVLNNGTLTFNRTDSYGGNFTPLISGTGAVTVSAGALILTAANTFSGATTVNGVGTTLTLTNSLALQNSALVTTGTGTVILSSVTTPTFGGLSGATGNLASVISSGYSGITSLTLNPAGSVTYGGVIADGAAGMTLTKTGAGTQILQGANSYSGATNFNAGTVNLTGNGHINTSTGLNFNGGSLLVTTTTVGEAAINRVNDTAAIISTGGGTITVTNTPSGTTVYSETMGALDLRGGQLNIVSTNANTTPAETLSFGSGSLTTINGSARAITDTSAITFSGGSLGASAKNSIIVTGQATTANNEIIGAWATFGATAALQTDYATYNITAGSTNAFGIQGAGIGATTSDAAWSTTLATTSNYNFANGTTGTTLTSTKNINSLRHTGSAETLTVATGANLGTYGILNGVSSLLTIAATGTGVVTLPTTTAGSLFVNAGSGGVTISAPITNNTGALTLVKDGSLILTLGAAANVNTYSGGTVINAGTVTSSASGLTNFLGSGTVTVNSGATLTVNGCSIANAITSNGGAFNISNGFASGFTGTSFVLGTGTTSTLDTGTTGSAAISNNVSGAGGLTKIGNSAVAVKLNGTNSYTGVTTISAGILQFKSSLYNNNTALWTPANIIVANTGTLMLNVGGASDFTTAQAGTLFGNLTTVNNNGLLSGSAVGFDTTNATSVVTYSTVLANSTGGGGGAVGLKKYGSGTLVLTGANTYSGPTIVEGGGTLKVSSFNSVNGGIPLLASSSLGAPTTVANGTITIGAATFIGGSIIYTGTGETTDRVINLAGQNATLVLDQSGTGLLKFTSALTIAAGNTKVITLQGSTGGTGELAAGIPMQGATQVLNKNGTGTWTLSGANLYTGLNTISGGTLAGTQTAAHLSALVRSV